MIECLWMHNYINRETSTWSRFLPQEGLYLKLVENSKILLTRVYI